MGQLENQDPQSLHPPINFRNPQKFIKAPNGCVSTQFMRNRMFEVYFPWSYVKVRLGRNKFADEVDRFAKDLSSTITVQ